MPAVCELSDGVEVSINLDFYPKPQVILAARDFSGACWVDLQDLGSSRMKVTLKPKSPGASSFLGHEFLNYLLSLARAR